MILIPSSRSIGVAAALVSLAACGSTTSTDDDAATAIVATTSIWADVTSNTVCGEDVATLVPAGSDPHSFEPSLRDRERLDSATTVIANGAGLEEHLHDLLTTRDDVVEVADHVALLSGDLDGHDGDGDHDESGDEHDGADPHLWLDPSRVAELIPVIADATGADPDCAERYQDELDQLDADIAAMVDGIPADRRLLVTSHHSLGYFADRYGFEVIGTVIPSTSTMSEASAAGLAELAATIEEAGVPAIFTDALAGDIDATALAERLGIEVVPLATGSLDETGERSTYLGMMRSNAQAIVSALDGSS